MKWAIALSSISLIANAGNPANDMQDLSNTDRDIISNGITYIYDLTGNEWSTDTEGLIDANSDLENAKAAINSIAEKATFGLRTLTAYYADASNADKRRCDTASGHSLNLNAYESESNKKIAKIIWQVKEVALLVSVGAIPSDSFKDLATKLRYCINHLPGSPDNLKELAMRDLATFEAKIAKPETSATIKYTIDDTPYADFAEYQAAVQGSNAYDHLFKSTVYANTPSEAASSGYTHCSGTSSFSEVEECEKKSLQAALGVKDESAVDFSLLSEDFATNSGLSQDPEDPDLDLILRQLAYASAWSAVTAKELEAKEALDTNYTLHIGILVLFLAILTLISGKKRRMINDLQKEQDDRCSLREYKFKSN